MVLPNCDCSSSRRKGLDKKAGYIRRLFLHTLTIMYPRIWTEK